MEKRNKIRIFQNIIGVVSTIALVSAFVISGLHSKIFVVQTPETTATDSAGGFFKFDGDLVYDGTAKLDLLKGVYAVDGKGNDVTDTVNATVTADGTLTKKTVRYTFFDANGKTVTEKRNLIMKNYNGPSIKASDSIKITADDLSDIINVLKNNGWLSADDGYGKDITDNVTCIRELVSGDKYKLTFKVINGFSDFKTASVNAVISGDVQNPVLRLTDKEIKIRVGDSISPLDYIDGIENSTESRLENVKVENYVDTSTAGNYRIVYKLYSPDKTALTTEVLKVTVS
ncbi:MAG: hypothetical protein PUB20_04545 [Clostridia bacterium]|nr:hypothetical protein [Clostridia bacterium]